MKALPGVTRYVVRRVESEAGGSLFADVRKRLGGLDVLVNNAGIAGPTGKVEEIAVEDWERCIAVDLNGMFYCTRLAMPMLKAAGGGCIINLSSAAGRLGFPLRTPYAAAKWGVVGFTKSLSMEAGTDNIRVNAIQPGVVEGERIDRVIDAKAKARGRGLRGREAALTRKGIDAHHGEPAGHRQHGAVLGQRLGQARDGPGDLGVRRGGDAGLKLVKSQMVGT